MERPADSQPSCFARSCSFETALEICLLFLFNLLLKTPHPWNRNQREEKEEKEQVLKRGFSHSSVRSRTVTIWAKEVSSYGSHR